MKSRSKMLKLPAALIVIGLCVAGEAHADAYAVSTDNVRNGMVTAIGSGITFAPVTSNSSSAASLNGAGVSHAAIGPNPDSPISALGSQAGRANETGGPVYYSLVGSDGSNYSWGDAIVNQEQTANTTITARNGAETNVAAGGFGNADGTNKSSTLLAVNVGNCGAAGCHLSFAFDADPYILAMVDAAAGAASVARGTLGFEISLTRVSDNSIVFSWTPNGGVGGILGGTEASDPENLNATLAAFAGQTLTHSGPYGAGVFSSFAATTDALAAGSYTLSIFMTEKTDVVRVAAVPEPETYALMLAGLGAAGFVARRRKVR